MFRILIASMEPTRDLRVLLVSLADISVPGANWGIDMPVSTILLIVLVLLVVGAVPSWPHSRTWGYAPSGALGMVALVVLVLLLLGRI
jgi:hypothetical protein